MNEIAKVEVLGVVDDWDRAMVENDPEAIGRYMAEDWTIIGPDGSIGDKQQFLGLVRSGALTHDVMESHDTDVRVYDHTAVVIARGISGGTYKGQPFYLIERVSSVFVNDAGTWRCVSTHLSRIRPRDE